MLTLADLKRLYRMMYVDILDKEQKRGYTTENDSELLHRLKLTINKREKENEKLQSNNR
jgi:transposase